MDFSRNNIPVWRWSVGIVLAITAISSWTFVSYMANIFGAGDFLFFFLYLQIGFSISFLVAYAFRRPGPRSVNIIAAMIAILVISILSAANFSYQGHLGRDYWYLSSDDTIILLAVTVVATGALWGLVPWSSQVPRSDPKSRQIIARGLWPSIGIALVLAEFFTFSLISWTGYLNVRVLDLTLAARRPELIELILDERSADEIIEAIAAGAMVDAQDEIYGTALSVAASKGDLQIARLLVEEGANPSITNGDGETALHEAAQGPENTELVKLLIGAGADPRQIDRFGSTPLHEAARSGSRDIAHLLIEEGAEAHVQNEFGSSALHLAASGCHAGVVRHLLDSGADPDLRTNPSRTNSSGANALIIAIRNCQEPSPLRDIVEALLTAHSDIEGLGDFGRSVLHLAALNSSDRQLFDMLIASGASLEIFNHSGETPLHSAVRYGSPAAVEALLIAGANPYRVDKTNSSALHAVIWSCSDKRPKRRERIFVMLDLLLDLGVDPNAQDDQGRSALDLAEEISCAADVVTFLRERM